MKNIKLKTLMLIGVLIAVIAACKGSTNGTFTGSDKQPLNITIAQNDMIKFTKTNGAGRTIVADPFEADELTFYLWGKAQSGQTLAPKNVTVTSGDGVVGKVILDIDCYNWSLTLAACESNLGASPSESDVLAAAVLIGYGNVDMMFTNSIKFTLTPKGLSKTGGVALTLTLESGMTIPDGYVATAYIYDIITGAKIGGTSLVQALAFPDAAPYSATYTKTGIAPGTYSFQVEFVKENENRKYVWNDTIIILPGKTVTQNIVIPNLIGTKPDAPADFAVQFNKHWNGTALVDEAEESKYPGFYTAYFSWDGSDVDTEMNFAMELAEIDDDFDDTSLTTTQAVFEAVWGTAANCNAKYTFDYLNDVRANTRFYRDGSLFANSTYVELYLELGKRYIARLYSENNAGYSPEPVYIAITPVANDTGVTTLKTINRFRVKYYNQGGTWNKGVEKGSEDPDTKLLPIVQYWSQSNQAYHVINAVSPGTAADPYLYKGPANWIYWLESLSSSTKYPTTANVPNAYADFTNLNLYASFSREGDIEIYNDKTYDIVQSWLEAFGLEGTVSKVATNEYSKGTATETTVELTIPAAAEGADPWKYDKVRFEISYAGVTYFSEEQVGAARTETNTFTIPLGNLPTGYVYNCLLTAQYQMTTVSYPFTMLIKD